MVNSLSSPEQEKVAGLLNKFGVDYIATGDFAMRKYVDNKYFQNIQLWVKPTPDNFQKISDAFASVRRKFEVDEKTFTTENSENALLKVGRGRKGIELYTGAPGMSANDFNRAFADRKVLNAGPIPIPILNEKDLHKTLEKSNQVSQKSDLQLMERAMPKLNPITNKKSEVQVIDWTEAARTIDPHKLLQDLGFTHMPKKGFLATSTSQTYERGEEKITVYPNKDKSGHLAKPIFIDQATGKKGDAVDLLNWQFNYDRKEVNRHLKDHFGGIAPTPLSMSGSLSRKVPEAATQKIDFKAIADLQQKELKEKYGLKNSLEKPEYLQSRGLSLNTIFRPEFFRQVLNSLGWSTKEQKTVNYDNTVFPLRNDHGIVSMIIRNANFKGFPQAERQDAVWLSNPPLSLNKDIKIGQGDKQVTIPKGTEGVLVPVNEKPGTFQFYYLDPHKAGKELNFNKLEIPGNKLEQFIKSLNPLRVDRLMITESPIDAMSFHQLAPPKQGETRMYLSTGGQPSEKQAAYLNQLVQRIRPAQIIMGNDNERSGIKFNINLMGAVQPPAGNGQKQFLAHLNEVKPQKDTAGNVTNPGEYHLRLFGAKDPASMEKVANRITDAINRYTPKGVEPPARITLLNGSAGSGSEATIAFPRNDRFLQTAQKQLEKIINEQAPAKEQQLVKVVKPLNKDFNEDLKQSQEQKTKVNYDLDNVPKYIKSTAGNLYHQLAGYTNNAFDALFGGVPGSLPKMESAHSRKEHVTAKIDSAAPNKENLPSARQLKATQEQVDMSKAPQFIGLPKKESLKGALPTNEQEKPTRQQATSIKESLPFGQQLQSEQLPPNEKKGPSFSRSAGSAKEIPQVPVDAISNQKSKTEAVKLGENPAIKPVAQVDLGFVRNEIRCDMVVIGQDKKGAFHEGIKAPGALNKVLWKSEMSADVKDLLKRDQIVFKFEPKLETGEKVSYGKDQSGNYFHTKNDYAIDLGLKYQWTRLDPREGKLMEFGNPIQQTTAKTAPDPRGKVTFELTANEARALSFALHHHLKKNDESPIMSTSKSNRLWEIQENFDNAIKKIDPAAAGDSKINVTFNAKDAKEIEKAVKEVLTTSNPKDVFLFKPDEWFNSLRSGHESINQSIHPGQKATTTLTDGTKKTAEAKPDPDQPVPKVTKVRL